MGYQKIPNLYKERDILNLFREVYALEKIHGTSAHVHFQGGNLRLFSGGENFENFAKLFATSEEIEDHRHRVHENLEQVRNGGNKVEDPNQLWDLQDLTARFEEFGSFTKNAGITLYGEAYGGKQQGMSDVYGPDLKFIVFEVKIGDCWLDVPKAEKIALDLGFEFVYYEKGPATLEWVNQMRDKDSVQAIRNGVGSGKESEGVVLRPLRELTKNGGGRIMVKHKRESFRETKTPRPIDSEKLKVLTQAQEIAEEWVVEHRLDHVLDKLKAKGVNTSSMQSTGQVVRAMIEDVKIEGEGEMVWSKEVEKAIGRSAATLYKQHVTHIEV